MCVDARATGALPQQAIATMSRNAQRMHDAVALFLFSVDGQNLFVLIACTDCMVLIVLQNSWGATELFRRSDFVQCVGSVVSYLCRNCRLQVAYY